MRMHFFPAWFAVALLLIVLNGCKHKEEEDKTPERTKPEPQKEQKKPDLRTAFSLTVSWDATILQIGDTLHVGLSSEADTLQIDSVHLYLERKLREKATRLPLETKFATQAQYPGEKAVLAMVYTPAGKVVKRQKVQMVSDVTPEQHNYEVVREYPHDVNAFTQGLFFHDGYLYEATGIKGESSVRKVDLETGQVLQSFQVDRDIFGEGITLFQDKIIQLSWRAGVGYVYDMETFNREQRFSYATEGWGLTTIGDKLVMSDGTHVLYYRDAKNFSQVGRVEVYDDKGKVDKLNELEYIAGEIFANIYMEDEIVRIDPASGKVLGRIQLKGLLSPADYHKDLDVLNGIAFDKENRRIFVTGKRWPKLFQIRLD